MRTNVERGADRSGGPLASSRYRTWAAGALRLYPRAWRDRYGAEVRGVLAQHAVGPWTVLDLLLGALDAHLHRNLLPGRLTSMEHRLRTGEIAVFCAFVLFLLTWLPQQQVRDPLTLWDPTVARHPEIRFALDALDLAGLIGLAAILAGGVPLLWTALRQALAAGRRDILALLAVPFLAGVCLLGYVLLAQGGWATYIPGGQVLTPLAIILQFGFLLLLLLAIAGSTAALAAAVARGAGDPRLWRRALAPAGVATAAIAAGLLGTLALQGLIAVEAPQLGAPGAILFLLLLQAAALGLAWAGWRRARRVARAG